MAGRYARRMVMVVACLTLFGAASTSVLAAPGGNAAASAACENGGYLTYTDAASNAFKNEGQCTRYAAQGGTLLVKPVLSVIWNPPDNGVFTGTVTGAGLLPDANVVAIGTFVLGGTIEYLLGTVPSTGELNSVYGDASCGLYSSLVIQTQDQDGQLIEATAPPPC